MAEVERIYYRSGKLKSEVFVINGKKNGEFREYHKNGQLREIVSLGKREGIIGRDNDLFAK